MTFYHAGETNLDPGHVEMLASLLPVEAARLTRDLPWDVVIPGPNDLYPNNAIPIKRIVVALVQVVRDQRDKGLPPGELDYYVKA